MTGATITPELDEIDRVFCAATLDGPHIDTFVTDLMHMSRTGRSCLAAICIRLGLDFRFIPHLRDWWSWRQDQDAARQDYFGEFA